MRHSSTLSERWIVRLLLLLAVTFPACSRSKYRLEADHDAYGAIAERNYDPRWSAPNYDIYLDPRSRYFDVYDSDCPPMPVDDPVSHQYMHFVNGMDGWKHWDDFGHRVELENPIWREALGDYAEMDEEGAIKLDLNSALRLAYVHSPNHQRQLETLYLSALDVTAERFRLDTQFFGGHGETFQHLGRLAGGESNTLTAATDAELRRRFATAGELLVGFANSFVFEFAGPDTNFTTSIVDFSLVQPLLRGAGRDVALEQLTFVERGLLANLRSYGQFRQGLYTQVAIGELGVTGPRRNGRSTTLSSFSGFAGLGGYLGLLQQLQQIRNTEDNLNLQLRTLARLEALLDVGVIDLVQVDQFRQSVERERANLLQRRNNFELELDRFKTSTLGLPPNLLIELNESLIEQFQLVPREATALQAALVELQYRISELPSDVDIEVLHEVLAQCSVIVEAAKAQFESVDSDFALMDAAASARLDSMSPDQELQYRFDRDQLSGRLTELEAEYQGLAAELQGISGGLTVVTRTATARRLVPWGQAFLRLVERLALVPARARLEAVTVPRIDLEPEDAFRIALDNRLDFMNGRAALVDSWRLVQVSADALQSVLDVTVSGDIRTVRNNPLSFRAPASTLRMGLEFDAPFTRLLERNAYREAIIEYQRSRRAYIQSRDSLHLGLRALLRQVDQFRENLEIQRRAVTIAIRRVDLTQAALSAPVRPPQPGQRPAQFNPTTAFNLLDAQSSLRDTQNAFLGVWLNYYATRMRLARELGTMVLDPDGVWIEYPIDGGEDESANDEVLPPPLPLPMSWGQDDQPHADPPPVILDSVRYGPPPGSNPMRVARLPAVRN